MLKLYLESEHSLLVYLLSWQSRQFGHAPYGWTTLFDGEVETEMAFDDLRKNSEGYSDPTAYEAMKNLDRDDERFHKLLHTIFDMCELAGFHLEERIVLRDEQTGKIWR